MPNLHSEFLTIAGSRTLNEAAKALNITPSCVSKHLKQLETEAGVPLINRNSGDISLTDAGRVFLVYSQQCQTILEAIKKDFSSVNRRVTLTIGIAPFAFTPFLFSIINSFSKSHPDLNLRIIEGLPDQLVHSVSQSLCDLAIICRFGASSQNLNVTYQTVQNIVLSLVVPEGHRLASLNSVSFSELENENLLILNSDKMLKENVLSACLYDGFSPNIFYEGFNTDHLIKMVRAGHGVTFLPKNPLKDIDTSGICFVNLVPDIPVTTDLVYIPDETHYNTAELAAAFTSAFSEVF